MSLTSPFPDVVVPNVSLFEFLFGGGPGDHGDAPAVIDGVSGSVLTFTELHEDVLRVAAGLHQRGVRRGDVVGILAPNSPEYAVVFHGAIRANATVTTINSMYTAGELAQQLTDAAATLLITVSSQLSKAREALTLAGLSQDAVITIDTVDGTTSLADLLDTQTTPPELSVGADDVAVLPYSAGTTGNAKGVMLTHRNLVANLLQFAAVSAVDENSKILAVLPFFHIYGMSGIMNQSLYRHATVVTLPRFDLEEFLRTISDFDIDRIYIAPPVAVALAKSPVVDSYDLSCLKVICTGAAPIDAELSRAMGERLGAIVLQGYGMTELSSVSHCVPEDRPDMDLNSCGVAVPNIKFKLIDPATGLDVGDTGRGELWVRGPNVMKGYLNNPAATAQALDQDGFLHTGDIVEVTADGVVTVVDRLKELIKYKGHQVPPAELEALLLTHQKIADVAVIGVLDADGEEVPKAFVVRQAAGADLTGDEVMTYVADRLAPYKKVRQVEFIDRIPKSASGKILRKDLRSREASVFGAKA